MKVTDLRIGNVISNGIKEGAVFSISQGLVLIKSEQETNYLGATPLDLTPVALTDDYLIRLGFVKKTLFTKGVFDIGLTGDDFYRGVMTCRIDKNVCVKLKSVHELQNLYHAITREELSIDS